MKLSPVVINYRSMQSYRHMPEILGCTRVSATWLPNQRHVT